MTTFRQRALVPVLVLVALMVSLVSSLGAPLVPTLAREHGVALHDAQWSLTLALLVGAVATPLLGRLGDGPRRRAVVLATLTAVLVGSLLAALPLGFAALLVGRGLQGLGLGLVPLTLAVAREAVPGEAGRRAVALLSVTSVAGIGLGYLVTGLLAQVAGTPGAFWFGAGLSGLALALAALVLPPSRQPARPVDLLGAVLLGAGVGGLLVALADAETWGWASARLLGLSAASVVLLAAWVRHQLRTASPLVDLRQLRARAVLAADATALLAGVGTYLLVSLVIRLVQTPVSTGYGLGASVALAGVVLLPMSLGSVAVSRVVPVLARRVPLTALLPVGCAVMAAALALLLVARSELWQLLVVMGLTGVGLGVAVSVMPVVVLRAVPPSETGSATAFNQVLRTVGYATGSALSGTVLQAHTPTGAAATGFPTAAGYDAAVLVGLVVCAAAVVVSAVLPGRVREDAGVPEPRDADTDAPGARVLVGP